MPPVDAATSTPRTSTHLPPSAERVKRHTRESLNQELFRRTRERIGFYAKHPELIDERLGELDREWDIERALETNAAALSLFGTVMGVFRKRWLLLPLTVTGFLLQHGLEGYCPPLPVLRRLGFRTVREIEAERYALKALRGDFDRVAQTQQSGDEVADATGRLGYAGSNDSEVRS